MIVLPPFVDVDLVPSVVRVPLLMNACLKTASEGNASSEVKNRLKSASCQLKRKRRNVNHAAPARNANKVSARRENVQMIVSPPVVDASSTENASPALLEMIAFLSCVNLENASSGLQRQRQSVSPRGRRRENVSRARKERNARAESAG